MSKEPKVVGHYWDGTPVLDVTEIANRPGCTLAERAGRRALVLSKCDRPVKCPGPGGVHWREGPQAALRVRPQLGL